MNLKEKMKRFWTLNVHNHEGFTLVELIIVIAILAILSSVAVVGYSSYVTKANMQADRTLVAEVANALQLAYYNNYENAVDDYVILSSNDEAQAGTKFAEEAMKAAFGDNWQKMLKLEYGSWKNSGAALFTHFDNSSFDGNLPALLDEVGDLSGALKEYLMTNDTVGSGFEPYLTENGIDPEDTTTAANAAVLYVAQMVDGLKDDQKEAIVAALMSIGCDFALALKNTSGDFNAAATAAINTATNKIKPIVSNSSLGTASLLYAYARAYSYYSGTNFDVDLANISNGAAAVARVQSAFVDLIVTSAGSGDKATTYFGITDMNNPTVVTGTAAEKDARAVVSSLGTINTASGALKQNISSSDCFSSTGSTAKTVEAVLAAASKLSEGDVLVFITADGVIVADPTGAAN